MAIDVALYQPLIPQNTGNIGRLCAGFKAHLHLIEPLGFEITDKNLKRAGLDYWSNLSWSRHKDFDSFYLDIVKGKRPLICFTKFSKRELQHCDIEPEAVLLFGKETTGVPQSLILTYKIDTIRIPIIGEVRAYNLANSVAIGLFESLRQNVL